MRERFLIERLIVLSFFVSCNKEENTIINTQKESQPIVTDGVVAGRYHFSSVESLTKMMTTLGKNSHLLDRKIEELYQEGFRPKYPVGDIDNDPKLTSFYASRMPLGDDLDDGVAEEDEAENDLVSDPILSTFLNENNELVVRDTLYKFTKKGVFFSHLKDTLKLVSYLKSIEQEEISEEEVWRLRETEFGKRRMVEGVYRFIAPISELEKNNLEKEKKKAVSRTSEADLQLIINDLPQTKGHRNWLLHTITGQSTVAEAYFDRRHRVKVEFFNQNYGFYKSMGFSVRNQTRRFRIWWASKANEIALGVNYIYLKYNISSDIRRFFHTHNSGNPLIFLYNSQYYYDHNYYRDNVTENVLVPFANLGNKKLLNIHIPSTDNYGTAPYHLFNYDILSNENLSYLYRAGFDFLRGRGSDSNEFIVTRFSSQNVMELIYFAERIQRDNDNSIKTHIYSDTNFLITFGQGMKYPTPSLPESPKKTLRNYSEIKLDIYGMARVGGEWKGVRLVL